MILNPTMITRAVDLLFASGATGVQPVVQTPAVFHPCVSFPIIEGRIRFQPPHVSNRQQMPKSWHTACGAVVIRPENFESPDWDTGAMAYLGTDVAPLEVSLRDAVHIDEPLDIDYAEWLLSRCARRGEKNR